MWFNMQTRRWEFHPDCRCHHDPCYCGWLPPLDERGKPMPYPLMDELRKPREDDEPATRKGAA